MQILLVNVIKLEIWGCFARIFNSAGNMGGIGFIDFSPLPVNGFRPAWRQKNQKGQGHAMERSKLKFDAMRMRRLEEMLGVIKRNEVLFLPPNWRHMCV